MYSQGCGHFNWYLWKRCIYPKEQTNTYLGNSAPSNIPVLIKNGHTVVACILGASRNNSILSDSINPIVACLDAA